VNRWRRRLKPTYRRGSPAWHSHQIQLEGCPLAGAQALAVNLLWNLSSTLILRKSSRHR
jgi:hypothetical protein